MNIAIWGCGKFGKYIFEQLKNKQGYKVIAWVDSNPNKYKGGGKIENLPVISNQEVKERMQIDIDIVLVAFVDSLELLREMSYEKSYRYGFIKERVLHAFLQLSDNLLEDRNIIWNNSEFIDKPILPTLETNIVDYCNLNCKSCSHFSNLFNNGDKVPFETFCRDLEQLSQKVFIGQFNMLGGEALLDDKIIEYIVFSRKMLPYTDITLVTNGVLLPKQTDDFFRCCIENDILISISGYRPTLQMKDKIQNILEKSNVIYGLRDDVIEFGKNIDLSGRADKNVAMQRCRQSKCHFFRNGKLYKCPFEALGNKFFQYYEIDVCLEGGIDIYDGNINWERVVSQICENPVDACRYCGVEEKVEWSVGNSPQVEDWIVN